MKSTRMIAFTLFAAALTFSLGAAPNPPTTAPADLGKNAALDYWHAFYWLAGWDENHRKAVDQQFETISPAEAEKSYVPGYFTPLKFLRFGARQPWCDFGLHTDAEGPGTLLPYLNWAHLLGKIALMRARVELAHHQPNGAVEYWADDLALARHIGASNIGVALLVEYGMQSIGIRQISSQLDQLDKPALDELSKRIDSLPRGGSPSQSVRTHLEIEQHWLGQILEKATDNSWEAQVAAAYGRPEEEIHAVTEACGGTPGDVLAKLRDLEPIYNEMANAAALPYEQFEQAYPAIDAKFKANPAHPLAYWDFPRICHRAALGEARLALLKAAIAVVRDGPETIKKYPDPFGQGPFTYRKLEHGFELTSKLSDPDQNGKPLTLTVGTPPKS